MLHHGSPPPAPERAAPFLELLEGEPPAWLPEVTLPPGVAAAWHHGTDELGRLVYVCAVGDGASYPLTLAVLTSRLEESSGDVSPVWPDLELLWRVAAELALEGALFHLPACVAGYPPELEGCASVVTLSQVGAVAGTPAFRRAQLAGAGPGLVGPGGQSLGLIS
ncbi:MAG: hypothetical protein AB7N73_14950 [Gemmatimonadales bacterium]